MVNGIDIREVSFAYSDKVWVLRNINLSVRDRDFLGICGLNGSGKSTLTYFLNGLIPHFLKGTFTGEVLVDGISTQTKNIDFFARKIGMVFQNPDFSLFNLTVAEEIEFGLKNLKLEKIPERISQALNYVGLAAFSKRDPQTLSLGEKQKVNLACVLALDTPYIVLDEPTAMLDFKSSVELYHLLGRLNGEGRTIIVVEHDTDLLWQFAKRTVILDKGEVISIGRTKEVLSHKSILAKIGIKLPSKIQRLT